MDHLALTELKKLELSRSNRKDSTSGFTV